MLKDVDSKKKEKEKAPKNKAAEENDDVVTVEIPDTLKDLKDDAYVLIPVSLTYVTASLLPNICSTA